MVVRLKPKLIDVGHYGHCGWTIHELEAGVWKCIDPANPDRLVVAEGDIEFAGLLVEIAQRCLGNVSASEVARPAAAGGAA